MGIVEQPSGGVRVTEHTGHRRRQLLAAADRVIRRRGPDASMDEIAAEAGVAKPILYRHFGNKDGLYAALVERYMGALYDEADKALVEPMMDAFRKRFSVTINVEGDDCKPEHGALWLKYWTTLGTIIRDYPPAAGTVRVTLDVKAKAKDVTVKVDKAGGTFVITAPRDVEVSAWDDKMSKPFRKVARKN